MLSYFRMLPSSLISSGSSISALRLRRSIMSLSKGPRKEWELDYDVTKRKCKIYLYERDLLDEKSDVFTHWTVCFKWEDGYCASYEANDEKGYLYPSWARGIPENIWPEYKWRIRKTFDGSNSKLSFSPRQVNEAASKLRSNRTVYSLSSNSCHTWAKELIDTMYPSSGCQLPIVERTLGRTVLGDVADLVGGSANSSRN